MYYFNICLKGFSKTTYKKKILGQDSQCSGQDLNSVIPEYNSTMYNYNNQLEKAFIVI
jgi:hypothetical protein